MRSWNEVSQVGEVQVLRNQEALVALRGFPDFAVAAAAQIFFGNRMDIVGETREGCNQTYGKILVEFDLHQKCGIDGTGRSSSAEAAAKAIAACTWSACRAGKSARMFSTESPAARLANTVRRVTRVPRNTGSPPQICGSLTILSSWFIGGRSLDDHTIGRGLDIECGVIHPSRRTRRMVHAATRLLLGRDPQRLHLPIKMAALQAQHFGGAGYVAVVLVEGFEDVVALVGVAGLMQGGELALGGAAAAVAVDQRGQVFAVESRGGGVHDDDALDHVAQFAHVAGPGVAHENVDSVVGDFTGTASVGGGEFFQEMAGE